MREGVSQEKDTTIKQRKEQKTHTFMHRRTTMTTDRETEIVVSMVFKNNRDKKEARATYLYARG
jgi:hypothetical protein